MIKSQIRRFKREVLKRLVSPFLQWEPIHDAVAGFTIVLGAPWQLRELLDVNLQFLARQDLAGLDQICIVFDRDERSGASELIESTRRRFPQLPLQFDFHSPRLSSLLQFINQSKFYASTNWCMGLKRCRTQYAILHDFDLYPLDVGFFQKIIADMRQDQLRFSGAEYTHYDSLTDTDGIIGTWELGIDAQWLRSHTKPIDCFHSVERVNGRMVDLDAFSSLQYQTQKRRLATGVGAGSYAHVKNLCSTFLRFESGDPFNAAWRIHHLMYLRSLVHGEDYLRKQIDAMNSARSGVLTIEGRQVDFSTEHFTCANVLRDELLLIEKALYNPCRPIVLEFINASVDFFSKFGKHG